MSDVFTNRTGRTSTTNLGKRDDKSNLGNTETEQLSAGCWNSRRPEPGRSKAVSGEANPQEPPRIRIDVPIGTSYQEIQESIFRQVYELAGTQLRAAIALGITPDTVSRILRRCGRRGIACPKVPEAWPEVNRILESSQSSAPMSR